MQYYNPMLWDISFPHILIIISFLISIGGATFYIRDTVRGTSKPNRVSWGMWALAPLIGTFAAISAGGDLWTTSRIFLAGFFPLIVFILSFFNKESYWELTIFDLLCGLFSLLALGVWLAIDSPTTAILFAAIGDGFAALPTIRKAWNNPETETGITFVLSFVSVLLVLPSIQIWNIQNAAFPLYLLVVNSILVFAIYRKKFSLK